MRFVPAWVIGTMGGLFAGSLLSRILGLFFDSRLPVREWESVLDAALPGVLSGICVGVAQAIVLYGWLPGVRADRWALATAAAFVARIPLAVFFTEGLRAGGFHSGWLVGSLFLLLEGVLLGVAQWLVLRSHAPRAHVWIGRTILGWALGAVAVTIFGMAFLITSGAAMATVAGEVVFSLWPPVVVGAVLGIITGPVLERLHSKPAGAAPRKVPAP